MLLALAFLLAAIGPDQPVAPVTHSVSGKHCAFSRVASNGTSSFVAWAVSGAIAGARVGRDGAVLDTPYHLVGTFSSLHSLDVVWVGGHYLVAWTDDDGTFVRRFAADATPLDAAPRKIDSFGFSRLVSDGTNAALLANLAPIRIQHIDADGVPIGAAIAVPGDMFGAAANRAGIVVLSKRGAETIHVAWNGTVDAPTPSGAAGFANTITAGGDRFLVIGDERSRVLDATGTPIGDPIAFTFPPGRHVCAWDGSSWITVAQRGDVGTDWFELHRIGADGVLDERRELVPHNTSYLQSSPYLDATAWDGARVIAVGSLDGRADATLLDFGRGDAENVVVARTAAEQIGGSIACTDRRALVVWTERTGLETFVVRGALIVSGQVLPPFEIADDSVDVAPAVATNGRDFFVVWAGAEDLVYGRTVSAEQILGTPTTIDYGLDPALALAWTGQAYVLAVIDQATRVIALSPSGARRRATLVIPEIRASYGDVITASLACDEIECALAARLNQGPTVASLPGPPYGGVFTARIAADGSKAEGAGRLTLETSGPPVVALRVDGASVVIHNDVNDRKTLRAVRLDSPKASTPLLTRTLPVRLIAADGSGFFWSETSTEGDDVHWSRLSAEHDPAILWIANLGGSVPAPISASSTAMYSFVTYATGDDDPALLAPRVVVRTFATIDPRSPAPPPPPRQRAAHH